MAQTAAQKAAAAKTLAANQAMLAKTEALLSKSKAKLSALQNPATVKATDYTTRNAGFEATGAIRTPEDVAKILNPAKPVVEPVVPTPLVDTKFKKAGTILRYLVGSSTGKRIPVFADGKGGEYEGAEEDITVVAGSTGGDKFAPERTLASDTFKNTLALLFGPLEASQPWVSEIFGLVSGFYKTGSSIEESINLGLYDAKAKGMAPQFTKRFDGVFKLQERLQKGEAISVPTVAEFIKAESDIGTTLREAGLVDLATQDFIGGILGQGKSVREVGQLISDTFASIDNAPKALKETLSTYFPSVDRVSLAKALLTGTAGAAELDKKIKGISVLSAAGTQGVTTDLAAASDIAAMGYGYNEALQGFGTVKQLERANVLAQFEGKGFTQQEATDLTFGQNAAAMEKARLLKEKEQARFSGRSGVTASSLRGKNAAGLI